MMHFQGVFDPKSKCHVLVTPAKRGKGSMYKGADGQDKPPLQGHAAIILKLGGGSGFFNNSRRFGRY